MICVVGYSCINCRFKIRVGTVIIIINLFVKQYNIMFITLTNIHKKLSFVLFNYYICTQRAGIVYIYKVYYTPYMCK